MKIVLSIFLSLLIMSPILTKLVVVSWWQQNRDQIAAEQCENRFDVSLMCSGKCVLVKEINKYDHQDQESNKGQLSNIMKMGIDVFDIYNENSSFTFNFLENTRNSFYFTSTHFDTSISVFLIKPPIV